MGGRIANLAFKTKKKEKKEGKRRVEEGRGGRAFFPPHSQGTGFSLERGKISPRGERKELICLETRGGSWKFLGE